MLTKVQKINGDLTIKIPSNYAEQCGFDNGCQVNVQLVNDRIVIEPTNPSFSSLTNYWSELYDEQSHSEMYYG